MVHYIIIRKLSSINKESPHPEHWQRPACPLTCPAHPLSAESLLNRDLHTHTVHTIYIYIYNNKYKIQGYTNNIYMTVIYKTYIYIQSYNTIYNISVVYISVVNLRLTACFDTASRALICTSTTSLSNCATRLRIRDSKVTPLLDAVLSSA